MARVSFYMDTEKPPPPGPSFAYKLCPCDSNPTQNEILLREGGYYAGCASWEELKARIEREIELAASEIGNTLDAIEETAASLEEEQVHTEVSDRVVTRQGLGTADTSSAGHPQLNNALLGASEEWAGCPPPPSSEEATEQADAKSKTLKARVVSEVDGALSSLDDVPPKRERLKHSEPSMTGKEAAGFAKPESAGPVGTRDGGSRDKVGRDGASALGAVSGIKRKKSFRERGGEKEQVGRKDKEVHKSRQSLEDWSSDDDDAPLSKVTSFELEDEERRSVALHTVHFAPCRTKDLPSQRAEKLVVLRGQADGGLRPVYEEVAAWHVEVSRSKSALWMQTSKGDWIELMVPNKHYKYNARAFQTISTAVRLMKFAKVGTMAELEAELRRDEVSLEDITKRSKEVERIVEAEPNLADSLLYEELQRLKSRPEGSEASQRSKATGLAPKDVGRAKPPKRKAEEEESRRPPLEPESGPADYGKGKMKAQSDEPTGHVHGSNAPSQDRPWREQEGEDEGSPASSNWDEGGLEDSEDDEKLLGGESICAICDDGGDIICCEGPCMRSFHATPDDGASSGCDSLNLTEMPAEYFCKQCEAQKHQCFVCGKLGSSKDGPDQEVYLCAVALCGHFYHPDCVAKALLPLKSSGPTMDVLKEQRKALAEAVRANTKPLQCPLHRCKACGQPEGADPKDFPRRFVACRRCPVAWHVECIPDDLPIEGDHQRVWGLNKVDREENFARLLYCRKHPLLPDLKTPSRDHIIWPKTVLKRQRVMAPPPEQSESEDDWEAPKPEARARKKASAVPRPPKPTQAAPPVRTQIKPSYRERGESERANSEAVAPSKEVAKKPRVDRPDLPERVKADTGAAVAKRTKGFGRPEVVDTLRIYKKEELLKSIAKAREKMQSKVAAITKETIKKKLAVSSIYSMERVMEIKENKIESIAKAVKTALKSLENKEEGALSFCPREFLHDIDRLGSQLRVYLAPFLHGPRYSSYGRHFTRVDKLEEVVERLQVYVEDGDCVVDMCCGANDFSVISHRRLMEAGKTKCTFKNFDLSPAKNIFNFEVSDWFEVPHKPPKRKLPNGDKLIIGLNPPFGVRAALASKFARQAALFRPKIIILIVPPETQKPGDDYELIWSDERLLEGKSFYLPGSVDSQREALAQWNKTAPPLFLWSRRDLADKHRAIAREAGHLKPETEEAREPIGVQMRGPWDDERAGTMPMPHAQAPYPGGQQGGQQPDRAGVEEHPAHAPQFPEPGDREFRPPAPGGFHGEPTQHQEGQPWPDQPSGYHPPMDDRHHGQHQALWAVPGGMRGRFDGEHPQMPSGPPPEFSQAPPLWHVQPPPPHPNLGHHLQSQPLPHGYHPPPARPPPPSLLPEHMQAQHFQFQGNPPQPPPPAEFAYGYLQQMPPCPPGFM